MSGFNTTLRDRRLPGYTAVGLVPAFVPRVFVPR